MRRRYVRHVLAHKVEQTIKNKKTRDLRAFQRTDRLLCVSTEDPLRLLSPPPPQKNLVGSVGHLCLGLLPSPPVVTCAQWSQEEHKGRGAARHGTVRSSSFFFFCCCCRLSVTKERPGSLRSAAAANLSGRAPPTAAPLPADEERGAANQRAAGFIWLWQRRWGEWFMAKVSRRSPCYQWSVMIKPQVIRFMNVAQNHRRLHNIRCPQSLDTREEEHGLLTNNFQKVWFV